MHPERHHPSIRLLHWLIATLVLAALVMSTFVMPHIPNSDPAKIVHLLRHIGTGGLICLLFSVRLVVRHKAKRPVPMESGMYWADRLAPVMHPLLDALVLIMLCSGIGMAIEADLPAIVVSGRETLPTSFATLPLHALHAFAAKMLIAGLILHISGAAFHQFILKDGLISRIGLGSYISHRTRGSDDSETVQRDQDRAKEAPAGTRG